MNGLDIGIFEDGGCCIVGYHGKEKVLVIPDTFDGSKVICIDKWAFHSCSSLEEITIPSTVTSIGSNAFYGCSSLASIKVDPNNPVYDSRDNCNAIIETETNTLIVGCGNTVIPSSVTTIRDLAFYGCSSLTSIIIPSGVDYIGDYAFYGCLSLTSVTIPDGTIYIGEGAFRKCPFLNSLTKQNGESLDPLDCEGLSLSDAFWEKLVELNKENL